MSLQPEFETYSYAGVVVRAKAQSVVECRLSGVGELGNPLALRAALSLSSAEAGNGEVKYSGKVVFSALYEDAEKNVCRLERGAEFAHHAQDERITPALTPRVTLRVISTSLRREGASVYASCVVEADVVLDGAKTVDYLSGGENIVCRKDLQSVYREEYTSGAIEVSDEFDADYVGDVLMHGETVNVQRVTAAAGSIIVSGEVAVNVCVLKKDGLGNVERPLPFRAELPLDAASDGMPCDGSVSVQSAAINVTADEEGGKSKISLLVSLFVAGMVWAKENLSVAVDAFGLTNRLTLTTAQSAGEYKKDSLTFTERVNGVASLSAPIDYSCALQALVLQTVEADCRADGDGEEIQGVVSAVLLVSESDGAHRSVQVQLPFALPFRSEVKGRRAVKAMALGVSARQKREGEVEVEATLKMTVDIYDTWRVDYLSSAQEGAPVQEPDCAFSVFLPRVGDSL
ncbi:MAG: hypothetical protein J6Z36_02215, partial [Clostridia bacterium]|nr:hypothetical protein [Clostridia bacterium]